MQSNKIFSTKTFRNSKQFGQEKKKQYHNHLRALEPNDPLRLFLTVRHLEAEC